jgi:nucleotide-binding universal stress UspA family protein
MFEKIIVCLDGSTLAEEILLYIASESGSFGKVILLKVLAIPEARLPLGIPGSPGVPVHTDSMIEHFQKELDKAPAYLEEKAQPLKELGADVDCVVLEGNPSEAIVGYSRDNEAGLIAIATHGHTGLRQIAMGSTAEYVLKHSGIPVLLVTPQKRK